VGWQRLIVKAPHSWGINVRSSIWPLLLGTCRLVH
jgi:hypothetical protein